MPRTRKRKTGLREPSGSPAKRTRLATGHIDAPLPSSESQPPRPKTLRISRIPRDVSPDVLKDWLEGLTVSDRVIASGNLLQLSIAPIDDGFSQATATFKTLPVSFESADQSPQNVDGPRKSKVVVDIRFDGMTVLYDPIQADAGPVAADVVAIPGLGGHALGSWRSPEGNDVWLRDFLPKDVKNVRTIIYGYDTNLRGADWKATIYEMAKSMLDNLRNVRDKAARGRPIIFIGHSLGGLVVKQALVIVADNKDYRPYQDILQSCYGVVLFGVPNQGIRYEELMGMVEGKRSEEFVRGLLTDKDTEMSDILSALNRDFGRAQNCFRHGEQEGLDMLCYYEKLKTLTSEAGSSHPVRRLLVTQSSATYTGAPSKSYRLLPMEGDHRSMVKFRTTIDSGYVSVRGMIQEFIDEAKACLRSLSFPEITYRRQQADNAHPNTCGWILRHESFRKWMDRGRTLLWIKGKPGAGKSTLMAFIYQALQKMPSRERHVNLDFFFHGRGTALQKTPIGMFRSLLHQLFCKDYSVRGPIRSAFREKKVFGEPGEDWEWQLKELQDLFFSAVTYVAETRMTTIFVDALDEAGPEAANDLVAYFHRLNGRLADAGGVGRICISCRHYPVVAAIPGLEIVVEHENYKDIATYVKYEVNSKIRIQECDRDSINARHELENTIIGEALGLFQWARLVTQMAVERYIETGSWSKARKLSELPKELNGLYEYILKKVIKDEYRPRALLLMQWICLAERPLSVIELRLAMKSDDTPALVEEDGRMENQVSSLSGGLAEVRGHTVQFIHQSVNDFILADGLMFLTFASAGSTGQCFGQSANPSALYIIGRGHNRLSRSCINYLQQGGVLQLLRKWSDYAPQLAEVRLHPFVLYAAKHWLLHAEKAENHGVSQEDLVQRLGNPPGEALKAWVKICRGDNISQHSNRRPNGGSTLLHVASSSGLRSTLLALLEKGICVEERDDDGDRALHHAARWGYKELITLLLDARADIEGENYSQFTPLECAVAGGHGDAVKLLLERGANVNRCSGESGGVVHAAVLGRSATVTRILIDYGADVNARGGHFSNALQAAAYGGHEAIVRLLLDGGADVNIQGGHYGNALQAAAYWGHEAIVQILLDKGAGVNIQGGYYGNALQAAAYWGHEAIVQILLDKGAGVNTQGGYYGNALQVAAYRGYWAIVWLLLDKGADTNIQGGFYDNALQAAAYRGHESIVRLLLHKGADINIQGSRYGNALQAAAYWGHEDIVRLLLDKGLDINIQGYYGNALQVAVYRGHEAIFRLLLDKGADINIQGDHYSNALQVAAYRGNEAIVRLLLDGRAGVNAQGGCYGNALQAAACGGHEASVRLLLDKGADINIQGGHYGNALQAAAYSGHEAIVQLLLDKGADINVQGGFHGNPLQAAAYRGNEAIVRLLLDKGADINIQGDHYSNALQVAAYRGNEAIVRLLLDRRAGVNAQGGCYDNALQAAACGGHEASVRLLLDKGADINIQGGHYGNALQAAAYSGHEAIVQLLLDKGADINVQGGFHGNPLQAAAYRGNEAIVQLLLDKGADINIQGGCYGNTLHAARLFNHQGVVKLLLAHGATDPPE